MPEQGVELLRIALLRGLDVVRLPFVKIPGSETTHPNYVRLEPGDSLAF
jgi:hypothetical protein